MLRATGGTATNLIVGTQSPGDNSTKAASTAYSDAGDALKVDVLAAVALGTGSGTLVQATHSNRHLGWTGTSTGSWAMPSGSTGDFIEVTNGGTATVSFTGLTPSVGHKASADAGETFMAVYETAAWRSLTPITARETLIVALGDETTAITTGTAKVTMRMPFAMTLTAVRASLTTVSSSGIPTFDINEAGTTILSTKLTIDASEKTSTTAATAAVISDTALADDAEITFDIDVAGTGAAGAKIYMIGYRA
jgi:hypothetical protein